MLELTWFVCKVSTCAIDDSESVGHAVIWLRYQIINVRVRVIACTTFANWNIKATRKACAHALQTNNCRTPCWSLTRYHPPNSQRKTEQCQSQQNRIAGRVLFDLDYLISNWWSLETRKPQLQWSATKIYDQIVIVSITQVTVLGSNVACLSQFIQS